MQLITEPDLEQVSCLPKFGRHIVVFDDDVVVYRAYRPAIGNAVTHGYFGG